GFPQYDSWFGTMVSQFLNGELGSLENVDPRFAALLYAGDRFEAKSQLEDAPEMYDMLSRSRPWATIQCYDAERGSIRLPEEISAEMLEAVQTVLAPKVRAD